MIEIDDEELEILEKIENVLKGWNDTNSYECMCEIYYIMAEAETEET